jgi:hypothetical protein
MRARSVRPLRDLSEWRPAVAHVWRVATRLTEGG